MFGWLSFTVGLGLSVLLINQFIQAEGLLKRDVLLGFGIKLAYAITYILIFQFYFSNGTLYGDSATFISDSALINQVFAESPTDFFRLMLGLEPLQESSIHLLNQTNIWSVGASYDWVNDNRLILKINALIHFFSLGNVYVHALVFCIFSCLGIVLIYKAFQGFTGRKTVFWFTIIAFPNLAFWGTGLLKESIFLLGFGLLVYGIYKWKVNIKPSIFAIALGSFLLVINKPYAGFIVVGFAAFYAIGALFHYSKRSLFITTGLALVMIISLFTIPSKLNLTDKISYKQKDLNNLAKGGIAFITDSSFCTFPYHKLDHFKRVGEDGILVKTSTKGIYKLFGEPTFYPFEISPSEQLYDVYLIYAPSNSYIEPTLINQSPLQLLKNSGSALINVLLRPFPGDNGDQLKYLSFISNLALLVFLIYALMNRRQLTLKCLYLVSSLIGASLLIALIIGWSVPIFGAIVRYKIPVDLLLLILGFVILKPISTPHETDS